MENAPGANPGRVQDFGATCALWIAVQMQVQFGAHMSGDWAWSPTAGDERFGHAKKRCGLGVIAALLAGPGLLPP